MFDPTSRPTFCCPWRRDAHRRGLLDNVRGRARDPRRYRRRTPGDDLGAPFVCRRRCLGHRSGRSVRRRRFPCAAGHGHCRMQRVRRGLPERRTDAPDRHGRDHADVVRRDHGRVRRLAYLGLLDQSRYYSVRADTLAIRGAALARSCSSSTRRRTTRCSGRGSSSRMRRPRTPRPPRSREPN